jgi:S1-C subfamily serine protease
MRRPLLLALTLIVLLAAAVEARQWAWLGVRIRDLSEQEMEEIAARHGIREGFGVFVVEVLEGTPAAKSGLQNGDVVVAFNDRPVTETRLLQRLIAVASTESDMRLTVLRREGRRQMPVRLVMMPRDIVGDRVAAEFGFVLRDAEPRGEPGVGGPPSGPPTVAAVLRGGQAERAGLQIGDVLLQVGDRAVLTRDTARDALADVVLDQPLRLTVRREGERLRLVVPAP